MMKKTLVFLAIAGLMLTTAVASADDADGEKRFKAQAAFRANLEHGKKLGIFKHRDDEKHFAIAGSVTAISASSITVQTKDGRSVAATVDSDTKFSGDVKIGSMVLVKGEVEENNTFEADRVMTVVRPQKAFGEITAKTDTSVTIKNNVTGESKTLVTNPDTKVTINGEANTTADIQVGDSGVIKFKAMLDSFVASVIKLFR